MKMKSMFLAIAAAAGLFGTAFAQTADKTHLQTYVRIGSIVKAVPGDVDPNLPLSASTTPQIYFDVKLVDTAAAASRWTLIGNALNADVTDRPYLMLNVPLKGTSTKEGVSLNAGEASTETTTTAVAYYVGPAGSSGDTMRFVYNVRPGDISEAISWANTSSGHPSFGGAVSGITLSIVKPTGSASSATLGLSTDCLQWDASVPPASRLDSGAGRDWPVAGYTLTIGDEGNRNQGKLYHGLVPLTVSTPGGVAPAGFTSASLVNQCYVWAETVSGTGAKTYVNIVATQVSSGSEAIAEADGSAATLAAFDEHGFFTGPAAASTAAFAPQRFYLNVSQAIPAGTTVRICYGVRDDGAVAGVPTSLYTYAEYTVAASPLTPAQATYDVLSADLVEESFELETTLSTTLYDAPAAGATVSGGTITASAGESVTLFIRKNGIDALRSAGKLYAAVEQISASNAARVSWSHCDVEMDPAATGDYSMTFSIPANAAGGVTEYRIHVPGLTPGSAVDTPYYLKVKATAKRETIRLVPAEGNAGVGTEFLQSGAAADGVVSFLEYQLVVKADATKARDFLVFPVTDNGYDIDKDAHLTTASGDTIKAMDAISKYVLLQTNGVSVGASSAPTLRLRVEKGETSKTFYVAALNDYMRDKVLAGSTIQLSAASILGKSKTDTMGDVVFSAASCNANGVITGLNDDCELKVQPVIVNRPPQVIVTGAPTSGALNSTINFSFTATDLAQGVRTVAGGREYAMDYLVAQMNYGDGNTDTYLYADDDVMTAMIGSKGWDAELSDIASRYGVAVADIKTGGAKRKSRNGKSVQTNVAFSHVYTSGSQCQWSLAVYDSAGASASASGVIELSTEQLFQFYTWTKATGGLGYVLWSTQTAADLPKWNFGSSYTYSALSKSGGNTLVTVQAVPMAAGATTPVYTEAKVSARYDSFFYKWSATSEYEELLPTGEDPSQNVYTRVISFHRDFVRGGGTATSAADWSDIVLTAAFVREWAGGDYHEARANASRAAFPEYTTEEPYLYDLGDYNTDGIPDGWALKVFGADEGRAMIEGAAMDSTGAEGDLLPALGWAGADNAYNTSSRIGPPNGSFALTGTAYDYKTRLRGRDSALNAADGRGNWISWPQWVVSIHPEQELTPNPYAMAGTLQDGTGGADPTWTEAWQTVKLATSTYSPVLPAAAIDSTENGVPYLTTDVIAITVDGVATDWAVVIDENGIPIRAGATNAVGEDVYIANTVRVCITAASDDYERIRYDYPSWCYHHLAADGSDLGYVAGQAGAYPGATADYTTNVLYPFDNAADTQNAQGFGAGATLASIDTFEGGNDGFADVYRYVDARVQHGILLDEPFREAMRNGVMDPRLTSWISRATTSADQDGDGFPNALEYFFWYYASRLAYAPVFSHGAPGAAPANVQIATRVWPAIDMRRRETRNSDARFRTTGLFAMGRRYLTSFNPLLNYAGPGAASTANNPYTDAGNATHCRGNFWEPIPVDAVLDAFHPLVGSTMGDPDNDGLGAMEEVAIGTNPIDCDSDNDYLPDGWEVRMGTDPVVDDGADNPDGDYFACVDVRLYPTYRHVYGFDYTVAPATVETVSYDREADKVSWTDAFGVDHEADFNPANVVATAAPTLDYARQEGRIVMLRDYEVYQAFGFDPMTGWYSGDTSGIVGVIEKFGAYRPRNTRAFTSKEEFFSGVLRARRWQLSDSMENIIACSTSPTNADSNSDGVPDGWEAYVGGFSPVEQAAPAGQPEYQGNPSEDYDQDGLPVASEFASRMMNLLADGNNCSDSMKQFRSETHDTWINKLYPSDPWNPDTDFDGLWDGAEGALDFRYGEPVDTAYDGGGCNPCDMDTDGDGMSDGWEARWFRGADAMAPNPTVFSDSDYDYDRDGLTNYQEYLTGFLRHLRYDLGPDASLLYRAKPGKRTWNAAYGKFEWATVADLPELYTPSREFANPGLVRSPVYYSDLGADGDPTIYHVHPLVEALGLNTVQAQQLHLQSATLVQSHIADPAIVRALDTQWCRTVLFPSERAFETDLGEQGSLDMAIETARAAFAAAVADYRAYLKNIDPQAFEMPGDLVYTMAAALDAPPATPVLSEIATRYAAVVSTATALESALATVCSDTMGDPRYDANYAQFKQAPADLAAEDVTGRAAGLGQVTDNSGLAPTVMNTWSYVEQVRTRAAAAAATARTRFTRALFSTDDADYGLMELIAQMDAAFLRLQTGDPRQNAAYSASNVVTLLALLDQIDAKIATLQAGFAVSAYPGLSGWVQEWMAPGGQMDALWTARREQILAYLVKTESMDSDPVELRREIQLAAGVDLDLASPASVRALDAAASPTALTGYEMAARAASMPFFVHEACRQAVRGFNGGLWTQPIRIASYITPAKDGDGYQPVPSGLRIVPEWDYVSFLPALGPIGLHMPFLPFEPANPAGEGYADLDEAVRLGRRVISADDDAVPLFGLALEPRGSRRLFGAVATPSVGGRLPETSTGSADAYPTTSPTVADSDADGMDDYWEVFHGLNPILGDYATVDAERNLPVSGAAESVQADASDYQLDKVGSAYALTLARGSVRRVYSFPTVLPEQYNPFQNAHFYAGNVTGYNYYAYPWLAGVPFADPDGDGLLNSEEAVNGVFGDKGVRYGTDPSPLWFTDPENPNSFASRFYARLNTASAALEHAGGDPAEDTAMGGATSTSGATLFYGANDAMPYVSKGSENAQESAPDINGSVLPFEVNEGFDTDGDGVSDLTELTSATILSGDPQSTRTPNRQQAAYFGGAGVLQSMADAHFGPLALRTFTLECWVKPDATQTEAEVMLIDRPWRFDETANVSAAQIRHNFQLGLKVTAGACVPFVRYTGAGTALDSSIMTGVDGGTPKASPTVSSAAALVADEWTHLAATYDGSLLTLYVNGTAVSAQTCTLVPANGAIALSAYPTDDVRVYSYRQAPILIGGTPADGWFASAAGVSPTAVFTDLYKGLFRGFIDEVRIWSGARTAAQIKANVRHTFTEAELESNRLSAFNERRSGRGYYQDVSNAECLAIYTFNDLPAGSKTAGVPDATPWETYPGQKTVGGATTPGSFLYRRASLSQLPASADVTAGMPTAATEVFTSWYALYPAALRSTKYTETEFVPTAHNTVGHLPLMDVEHSRPHRYRRAPLRNGSPEDLSTPSGDPAHNKPADSVYWSAYAAGTNVTSTVQYPNIKTNANPYGYRYEATIGFDTATYREHEAFTYRMASDLVAFGDVYPKYDFSSWNNSPSSDPASGDPAAELTKPKEDWFDFGSATGTALNSLQSSKGAEWLAVNVANGSTEDTDGDRMPNWWESYYGLDPENATGVNGPHGDPDGDALTNYAEYLAKSDPAKYSTVGNEVPDYHTPIFFRRGRPTFGLLYTDNDFVEDHWEASNRSERLSVDLHDALADADGDGWSNWAEARANFRTGNHSTNPNAATSISQSGKVVREMPTPALRMTVDYFGNQNVYTNAVADAKLMVHAYTASNSNTAPDATFELPLAASGTEVATVEQEIGLWNRGVFAGYLHIGNITPGSLKFSYRRIVSNETTQETTSATTTTNNTEQEAVEFVLYGDTRTSNDIAALYAEIPTRYVDEEGNFYLGTARVNAGEINYRTGFYVLDFSNEEEWPVEGYLEDEETGLRPFDRREFLGTASYKYGVVPGQSNTYTIVRPASGYLREGLANFFVFADLNGDGFWNDGEPAGIPDQHDVDIGFDQVNRPLHVSLSEIAPPGSVRLDVRNVLASMKLPVAVSGSTSTSTSTDGTSTSSSSSSGTVESGILNPTTGEVLDPALFGGIKDGGMKYWLMLTTYENVIGSTPSINPEVVAYGKPYNPSKPYLTEDDIFAESASGLPGTASRSQVGTSYKAYLVPETLYNAGGSVDTWRNYNVAVVTNYFSHVDASATRLLRPIGGEIRHNTELSFEWTSNAQVPTFTLTVRKVRDAAGAALAAPVTVYSGTARGVTPCAVEAGNANGTIYRYRYTLPRGIGELRGSGAPALFGNGGYSYSLSLQPYNGSSIVLDGDFALQLTDSGDPRMRTADKDTSYNVQDSWYVRAQVRYSGVLKSDADFDERRLMIEAHYSASFNGDPVAAVSDILVHDASDPVAAAYNPYVIMSKDRIALRDFDGDGAATDEAFWTTRFDAELRGLPTDDDVYLVAYFDLNLNGKRDAWEPWGYATQGAAQPFGHYFDPATVKPVNSGVDYQVEFYIQDVDTDNDKLADSWEWLQSRLLNLSVAGDFSEWADNFTGSGANHAAQDIWTAPTASSMSAARRLTAYGAQLYGLPVGGVSDDGRTVTVGGVASGDGRYLFTGDGAAYGALALDSDAAQLLLAAGYDAYILSVGDIGFDGETVALAWKVLAAKTAEPETEPEDVTALFAAAAYEGTVYAVYGKADLAQESWTLLATVPLRGTGNQAVVESIGAGEDGEKPAYFKVRLFAEGDTPPEALD